MESVYSTDAQQLRRKASYTGAFVFFDLGVRLFSDSREFIELIKGVYPYFITLHPPETKLTCYIITGDSPAGPYIVFDDNTSCNHYPLPASESSMICYAELMLFKKVLDLLQNALILHAGVVEKAGTGYIFYAPSGLGKTTLMVELINRGYRFLSDEFCILKLDDFYLHPFPRRLGIKENNPFFNRIDLSDAYYFAFENKYFVDCNAIKPQSLAQPCAPGYIIELTDSFGFNSAPENNHSYIDLILIRENDELIEKITSSLDVTVVENKQRDCYVSYRLFIPHKTDSLNSFHTICSDYDKEIVGIHKSSEKNPDYSKTACIKKVPFFESMINFIEHMVNRAPTSGVTRKYGGKMLPLVKELSLLSKSVKSYTLQAGTLSSMGDIIDSL